MGIQILWDGNNLDMSNSARLLKDQMLAFIQGMDREFVKNLDDAEEEFYINEQYPIEDKAKMRDKFNDFVKEILKQDLSGFLAALPENKFGRLKETIETKRGKEDLSQMTVADLFDSANLNKLAGLGAFQYGRGMEGVPKFDFFNSELNSPRLKVDVMIEEDSSGKKSTFKLTTKKEDHHVILQYPKEQNLNVIRDAKVEHLEKHGVYNPSMKVMNNTSTLESGKLMLQISSNVLDRVLRGNSLIRDARIKEVEILEDGVSTKGVGEPSRTPNGYELGQIAERVADLINDPNRRSMDSIIEIDGKTYRIELGKLGRFEISNLIEGDIEALIAQNERKFKMALKPVLDEPTIVASGMVELDLVTTITDSIGQSLKGAEDAVVMVDGRRRPVPKKEEQRIAFFDRLAEEVGNFQIIKPRPEDMTDEDYGLLFDEFVAEQSKEINRLKKEAKRFKTFRTKLDKELGPEYERLREELNNSRKERNDLKSKKELDEKEKSRIKNLDILISQNEKEMKESLEAKRVVMDGIERIEKAMAFTKQSLERVKALFKEGEFTVVENIISDPQEKTAEFEVTQSSSLGGTKARTTARQLASFSNMFKEGIPVIYKVKVEQLGEFDLNPYKYKRGSPKSFDKEILQQLRGLVLKIKRIQREIRG